MSKLDIKNEMAALDKKDRHYYDNLDEVEKKQFGPFVLAKWAANVEGDPDFQEWYLRATNERVNINFFDISATHHKKLQWLLCTTVSPNLGVMRHYWVAPKKVGSATPGIKLLKRLYPAYKQDEVELLLKINTLEDIKELAKLHGIDDREIKTLLK